MAGENEKIVLEVKEAVDAMRSTVEKYGAESAEFKEMLDKTEKAMEADHKAHEEMMVKQAEQEKKNDDLEERVKDFELRMAQKDSDVKTDYKDSLEYKSLSKYFQYGEDALDDEEHTALKANNKTMRMDDDTAGGYLTTTEFDTTIIKKITEVSAVRQYARVRSVSKKTMEIPKRESIPTATYEGEAAAGGDDQSAYGNEQLTTYRLTVTVPFTQDLLGDSAFDLESEITGDVAESMAQKEGAMFVNGDGANKPEGFLVHPDIVAGAIDTQTTITLSGDDLLLLTGQLKVGYNPMYGFNRATLAFLRTLKASTSGTYIWQASLAPNVPNTIGGEPYAVFNDMPDYTTIGNLPVIYGDFKRGYTITDRTGTLIIRDQYAKKRQAIIEMTFHRWNTGQVTLAEAFVALEVKS